MVKNCFKAILITLFVALVVGCFIIDVLDPAPRLTTFNHRVHVAEGMGCEDCHELSEKAAGMPDPEFCADCHESPGSPAYEEWIAKRKRPDGKVVFSKTVLSSYGDVVFSHETHKERDINCKDCHGPVGETTSLRADAIPDMADCEYCHSGDKAPAYSCSKCHRRIRKNVKPPTHDSRFRRNHGMTADFEGLLETSSKCSLCHTEESCSECHRSTKPRDHGTVWRDRAHGLAADIDRERCMLCHTQDYCSLCHLSTMPKSHFSLWGPPKYRHCLNCHISGPSTDGCTTCHDDFSHSSAPSGHGDGTNCGHCHSIPHPDSGDPCHACHQEGDDD